MLIYTNIMSTCTELLYRIISNYGLDSKFWHSLRIKGEDYRDNRKKKQSNRTECLDRRNNLML